MTRDVRAYPILIQPLSEEDGGGFLATIPDLPGCMGDGESMEEAIADGYAAAEAWIETARAFGDPVPEPSSAPRHWHARQWHPVAS